MRRLSLHCVLFLGWAGSQHLIDIGIDVDGGEAQLRATQSDEPQWAAMRFCEIHSLNASVEGLPCASLLAEASTSADLSKPLVQFAAVQYSVAENAGVVTLAVVRGGGSLDGESTVLFRTVDGTAKGGAVGCPGYQCAGPPIKPKVIAEHVDEAVYDEYQAALRKMEEQKINETLGE